MALTAEQEAALKKGLAEAYAARNGDPSEGFSETANVAQAQAAEAAKAQRAAPLSDVEANLAAGVDPYAGNLPGHGVSPQIGTTTPVEPVAAAATPPKPQVEATSSIPSQVNQVATTTADVPGPTKLPAPTPVVKPKAVAQSPAQTAGMPPEISPENIASYATGLEERINNVKLAQEQNERGPRDIYAQQVGQVLDKKADFYNHSLDMIRETTDRIANLNKQLQDAGPFSQPGQIQSQIASERSLLADLVHNSNSADPSSPAARVDKFANLSDMATAALSGDQRDDLTRATNDKVLLTIKAAELEAIQHARASNDQSLLTHAMTGKSKAEGGLAGAQIGLTRAQTKQTEATTGYTQQGMAALGLLNRLPANGMTPEIEQAIGTLHPDLRVPGAGGIAPTPEIAKKANDYLESTDPLLNTIQNAVNFRSNNGFTVPFTKSNEEAKTMGANLRLAAMNDEEMKRVSPETVKMFERLTPLDIGTVNPHAMEALQTYQRIKADQRASKLETMGVKYWKRPTIFKPGLRG